MSESKIPVQWTEKAEARKVLEEILEKMRHKRAIKTALPLIAESMINGGRSFSPSDYKKFTHQIGPYHWQGIIYKSRNTMMGTIFSYFGNKAIAIRGFPKIKYAEDSRVFNQPAYAENKYDGTNLGLWLMPNGEMMGKTREVEWWTGQGYKGRIWKDLFMKTGFYDPIMKLLKEDYMVFGELYGAENPGEFVRYTIPINFKVFDIVDRRNFSFIPLERKEKLIKDYKLDYVGLYWKGQLTMKEVERIEYEASTFVKEDGYEGFVAKYFDSSSLDTWMCKLKCKEIHEKAWALSPRAGIPRAIIGKAVRKALEANIRDMDQMINFVKQELLEEVETELVEKSTDDIKRAVYKIAEPIQGAEMIFEYLKELEFQGIDVSERNKRKVMSMLGIKFFGQSPSFLYNSFMTYLSRKEKRNG